MKEATARFEPRPFLLQFEFSPPLYHLCYLAMYILSQRKTTFQFFSSSQIEEEIEEVTEYLDDENDQQLHRSYDESVTYPIDTTVKTVVTTKTSKPMTLLSTPYPAIRGDIDCVLADISPDREDDERKVP